MKTHHLIYVAIIWVVPFLLSWRAFRKMNEKERQEIIIGIKNPLFILSILPLIIGFLVFLTGSVFALGSRIMQNFGISLVFFGWFVLWVVNLMKKNESVTKSLSMIVIGIFGVIVYIYLF